MFGRTSGCGVITMHLLSLLFSALALANFALAALPLNGADISSLPMLESQGISYTDGGSRKAFESILSSHGFKLARIRVWTAGTYTQDYAINLARRAKNAGMKILVDLHYSDTCECSHTWTFRPQRVGRSERKRRGRSWEARYSFVMADRPQRSKYPDLHVCP